MFHLVLAHLGNLRKKGRKMVVDFIVCSVVEFASRVVYTEL